MRLFVTIFFAVVSVSSAQQQQVDPAYLRQYYAQLAQQGGARGAPIYEAQEQPQYVQQQPQQLKNYQRPVQHQQQQQVQYVPEPQQQHQPRQYQQPQQVQYQQPKAAPKQPKRPAFPQETEEESPEDYDPNPSYQFGFDVKDDEFTNYQNRKEQREGGVIKGSYSVVDSDGFIRTVTYTADPKEGFKAEVVREPTDIVVKTPTPAPQTEQPQHGFRQAAPKHSQPQYVPSQQPEQHQQQYRQQAAPARPDYSQYQQ